MSTVEDGRFLICYFFKEEIGQTSRIDRPINKMIFGIK